MSIVKLTSTNFKRIKAVEISPDKDGNLVIISGKNGQGKSSVLDSITAALGGTSIKTTPRPIRDGETKAEIVLETEDLVVTRKFTPSGSTLTVKSPDGAIYPKGQAKLDELVGKLSLDPLAFTQLDEKKQLAQLLDLVDLPFNVSELDAERKALFDQRAELGRQGKAIGEVAVDSNLPAEETSASQIISAIRMAQDQAANIGDAEHGVAFAKNKVDELAAKIAQLTTELEGWTLAITQHQAELDAMEQPADVSTLEEQLAGVEETNAMIRANNAAKEQEARKKELRASYESLTEQINAIDKRKADGLAKAQFPVDGLGFDADGVTYQGVPFKQASTAEQIRVSLGMAMALSPKLKIVRIADGSMLDSDNLALVEQMATEKGFQVWLEIVEGGQGFEIVDGELA